MGLFIFAGQSLKVSATATLPSEALLSMLALEDAALPVAAVSPVMGQLPVSHYTCAVLPHA